MSEILFTKIQFEFSEHLGHVTDRILLDFPAGELSRQEFSYSGVIISSIGIILTEEEKDCLRPYLNAADYERYRDNPETDSWDHCNGYWDCVSVEFAGITNASIPLIRIPWSVFHDEKHMRPYEHLFEKLNELFNVYERKPRKRRDAIVNNRYFRLNCSHI